MTEAEIEAVARAGAAAAGFPWEHLIDESYGGIRSKSFWRRVAALQIAALDHLRAQREGK